MLCHRPISWTCRDAAGCAITLNRLTRPPTSHYTGPGLHQHVNKQKIKTLIRFPVRQRPGQVQGMRRLMPEAIGCVVWRGTCASIGCRMKCVEGNACCIDIASVMGY